MFSFFRKKTETPVPPADVADAVSVSTPHDAASPASLPSAAPAPASSGAFDFLKRVFMGPDLGLDPSVGGIPEEARATEEQGPAAPATPVVDEREATRPVPSVPVSPPSTPPTTASPTTTTPKTTTPSTTAPWTTAPWTTAPTPASAPAPTPTALPTSPEAVAEPPREAWFQRLRKGLARTGSGIAQVFTGTKIDDALYEELEAALLMADAGVKATGYLLDDLRERVRERKATDPAQVKSLLADAIVALLAPLERSLMVGEHTPTVIMVAGVNGAGKTTSIGKLTRHLAEAECKVLLAAADTFRAAAREQLAVWADRNRVEIVSQEGGDPASVTFDAVTAGRSRGCDVVIADTAGRLPTQLHLMEELRKIKRVITKADATAPHEVLLVVDGNTGQNALEQVKAFDAALGLTGLVITKLDGTAKGGVLAAIALWSRERAAAAIPVYFIGVGEKLEDLQTFNAREFAQALLG